jgi:hypothetical protein
VNVAWFFDEVGQWEIQLLSGDSWFFVNAILVVMSYYLSECTVYKFKQGLVDISMEVFEGEVIQILNFRTMLNWIIWKEKRGFKDSSFTISYIIPYSENKGSMQDIKTS